MIYLSFVNGSSRDGQSQTIDSSPATIGRGADNAVRFDAYRDVEVSTRHARVRLEEGRIFLCDLGSTNGTFVNGSRLEPNREFPLVGGERVMLGEGGPEIVFGLNGPATPSAPATIQSAGGSVRGAGSSAGAFGPRVGSGAGPATGPGQSRVTAPAQVRVPIGQPRPGGGPATTRTTPRSGGGGGKILLLLLGAVVLFGGGVYVAHTQGYQIEGLALPSFRSMGEIAADAEDSVCLVILERRVSADSVLQLPMGTAWIVEGGKLATNAHVAKAFDDLGATDRMFVRTSDAPPRDITVTGRTLHPGYERFNELRAMFPNRTSGAAQAVNPCDVALFEISDTDRDLLGDGLRLETTERLKELSKGQELGSVGFPIEGQVNNGTVIDRPESTVTVGPLSKMSDPFLGRAPGRDAVLLTYQIEGSGGVSGSPVLAKNGRVVGLISGGHTVGKVGGARVSVGGTTFGPRADMLRELIEGVDEDDLDRRFEFWHAQLKASAITPG